jgi:hypothetical protein
MNYGNDRRNKLLPNLPLMMNGRDLEINIFLSDLFSVK